MNKKPLVSIICSCYNHSKFIEETLNSVALQTYKNIQLIIVDDFSTDNSVEIIENWIKKNQQGVFIKNSKNLGLTSSFNNAFTKVEGDYFIDLAADDILLKDCVEKQVNKFIELNDENVAIVYGNAEVCNENLDHLYIYYNKWPQKKTTTTLKDGFIYTEILDHSNTICSISSLVKTKVFKDLNGYDPNLMYEDYDFWLRVSRKFNIIYIDDILVKKRELTNSLSTFSNRKINKKSFLFNKSTYLILRKTLKLNRNKEEDLASIKKIKIEIEKNLRILNFGLILKYFFLYSFLKKRITLNSSYNLKTH